MVRIRRSHDTIADLHRRMERVMEHLLREVRPSEHSARGWVPCTNIYETRDELVVTLEIPGIEREEIDIVVEGPYLKISGVRPEPATSGCMRWHQMEISYGPFERIIAVSETVDLEKITAIYRDGFLTITIRRAESSPRSVRIET